MHLLRKMHFKMLKILENPGVHPDILCLHTKFCEEKTFYVACAKKTKKCPVKSYFGAPKIVFFYTCHRKCDFLRIFVREHKMSRCTPICFLGIFIHLKICSLVNGCICTYEPKWITVLVILHSMYSLYVFPIVWGISCIFVTCTCTIYAVL
jgi:hypothetical protein